MTAEQLLQEILDRWNRGEIYSDEMKRKIEDFLRQSKYSGKDLKPDVFVEYETLKRAIKNLDGKSARNKDGV